MCRTIHAIIQSIICMIQMLIRIAITVMLMIENLIRMILQTLYNFISFILQIISLLPICLVFLVTSRLRCLMCSGGRTCCGAGSNGCCNCFMTTVVLVTIYFILRETGHLDMIFLKLGYSKTTPLVFTKFVPTLGGFTDWKSDTDDGNFTDSDTESTYTSRMIFTKYVPTFGGFTNWKSDPDFDNVTDSNTESTYTSRMIFTKYVATFGGITNWKSDPDFDNITDSDTESTYTARMRAFRVTRAFYDNSTFEPYIPLKAINVG